MKHKNLFSKKPSCDDETMPVAAFTGVEHPSKRIISTSIFPPPSQIPTHTDVGRLEDLIPKFWDIQRDPETNEILMTKEQFDQLAELILNDRKNELEEAYTEIIANFKTRRDEAMDAALHVLPQNENVGVFNLNDQPYT